MHTIRSGAILLARAEAELLGPAYSDAVDWADKYLFQCPACLKAFSRNHLRAVTCSHACSHRLNRRKKILKKTRLTKST